MAVIIILLVFVFILMALLIMPIHVRINPEEEEAYKDKPGFFRLTIDLDRDTFISIILNVFFIRFSLYPKQKKIHKAVDKKESRKKSKPHIWNWNRIKFLINVVGQYIKRFKIKKLYMDLDTSNVIINANLYPVFELMNERPRISLNINYSGNFALCLDVQNNLWNVVRIFLYNLIKRIFTITKNKLYGIQSR
jgi:hypothetical protein